MVGGIMTVNVAVAVATPAMLLTRQEYVPALLAAQLVIVNVGEVAPLMFPPLFTGAPSFRQ